MKELNKKQEEKRNKTISMLKKTAESTFNSSVMINPDFKFGALYSPDFLGYKEPLLVSSADSIGTKLKFAIMADKHDTIGFDLVAMSVNNILF